MAFLCASALSLVLPTPVTPPAMVQPVSTRVLVSAATDSLVFPATTALALFDGPKADVIKGGVDSLDLDSLLDSMPEASGKQSKQKEDPGLQRLRERQVEEAEAAKEKYEAVLAAEAAGKDLSFAGTTKESANAGIAAAKEFFGR